MGEDEPPGPFYTADSPRIARGSGESVLNGTTGTSGVSYRWGIAMTNQRIVFYVTKAEKMALDKISKETGARVSELMRRAFKMWLKGQKG